MSTPASTAAQDGILTKLAAASAAEEFFVLLGVPFEARIVNVARLHILKRMGQYIARENFEGLADEDIAGRCKAMLERAYADFVKSSPLDERVFKVLREAVAPPRPVTFVPFETLLK